MKLKLNTSFLVLPIVFSLFLFGLYLLFKRLFDFPDLTLLSLSFILFFFGGMSLLLFGIIDAIFIKNKEVVGMSFMLITTIKTIAVGIIGKIYILSQNIIFEKWHYFTLFILYLFKKNHFFESVNFPLRSSLLNCPIVVWFNIFVSWFLTFLNSSWSGQGLVSEQYSRPIPQPVKMLSPSMAETMSASGLFIVFASI